MTMARLVTSLPVGATPISSPRSWVPIIRKRVTTLSPPATCILEVYAGVGDGGTISRDRPLEILAAGFLAAKQFIVADEVGGQHIV